jgi:hypothetical protein
MMLRFSVFFFRFQIKNFIYGLYNKLCRFYLYSVSSLSLDEVEGEPFGGTHCDIPSNASCDYFALPYILLPHHHECELPTSRQQRCTHTVTTPSTDNEYYRPFGNHWGLGPFIFSYLDASSYVPELGQQPSKGWWATRRSAPFVIEWTVGLSFWVQSTIAWQN